MACEIEYKDRPVEVKVPVACKTPDTFCDKKGSLRPEGMDDILRCITDLRDSTAKCK